MVRANVKLMLKPSVGIEKLFLPGDDEETLWKKLADFTAKEYGVTSILYAFTHSKYTVTRTGIMPSLYIRHNHPEDYIASFPAGKLTLEDSIAAEMILKGHTAFIWSDYDEMELSAASLERVAADRAMGMGVGVSFGFRFGSGIGGMCWAARNASAVGFRSMWQSSAREMELLAHLFDQHMRPAMVRNRIRLTPREMDVLSYSAGGSDLSPIN